MPATSAVPSRRLPDASGSENIALTLGAASAGVGAVIGALVLRGTTPLFGRGSIGELSSWVAMLVAAVSFLVSARLMLLPASPWLRRISWVRRAANLLGLAALHAVFAFMLTSALFAVFSAAFSGVRLDRWAATFWVAAACAVCAYICSVSAAGLTTRTLSSLLAAFLVTGMMVSALSSPDPHWWQHHFSFLGAASGDAGVTFNLTLLLAGLSFATIGDFLGHDLQVWAEATGQRRGKVRAVRIAMVVLGILLVLVALIPVNVDKLWHDAAAQGIVVVFGIVLIAFPIMFRRLPGSFQGVTVTVMALLVVVVVLWKPIRYLNTTAFEMGAATIVFVWLLLFVRSVTAAVQSLPESSRSEHEAA